MPITRHLLEVGNSRSVTLPKTWLDYAEQKENKKIVGVAMEINGTITLSPIFEKKGKKKQEACPA
jgi:antitoxin component of MazEF toxin-antitoxin module